MKQSYEAPAVTVLGSVQELTQGGLEGLQLDGTFSIGTPKGELTFSG
jgi:hypothetical protein